MLIYVSLELLFCLHLHGNEGLEEDTSRKFNLFLEKIGESVSAAFQGVCMDDISIVEDFVQVNSFLYDVDVVNGAMIGELARSVWKHSNTVPL